MLQKQSEYLQNSFEAKIIKQSKRIALFRAQGALSHQFNMKNAQQQIKVSESYEKQNKSKLIKNEVLINQIKLKQKFSELVKNKQIVNRVRLLKNQQEKWQTKVDSLNKKIKMQVSQKEPQIFTNRILNKEYSSSTQQMVEEKLAVLPRSHRSGNNRQRSISDMVDKNNNKINYSYNLYKVQKKAFEALLSQVRYCEQFYIRKIKNKKNESIKLIDIQNLSINLPRIIKVNENKLKWSLKSHWQSNRSSFILSDSDIL